MRRIRFLGLFDTVNSVPRFESAWMQRSKFPYTARSSAKFIRHAVSIDERRAKFRQDLISGVQLQKEDKMNPHVHRYNSDLAQMNEKLGLNDDRKLRSLQGGTEVAGPNVTVSGSPVNNGQQQGGRLPVPAQVASYSSCESLAAPVYTRSTEHLQFKASSQQKHGKPKRRQWSKAKRPQDIEEVWFAGGHGDIGGGWTKGDTESWMLSHAPLVWMVHEAERAGLKFDPGYDFHFPPNCLSSPDRS